MVSEDWLATLVGLGIVAIVAVGLLGPGPQTVALEVVPGETGEAELAAGDGWKVTALLADDEVTIEQAATEFHTGEFYQILCEEGRLTMQQSIGASSNSDKALITASNNCAVPLTITYKLDPAIPWPLFGLLDKE